MNDIAFASIKHLKNLLAKKEISPSELLAFFLKRFAQYDQQIGSALEIFESESIQEESSGQGLLAGIPGIIKDNICQKNRITACSSKMLEHFRATYDATAVSLLKKAGAVSVGRANCDEFAMGSSTETSAFQKTKNPWNLERVPGGSSGGSIAAVAAGLVPWALGSETGGSVRQPAALCGIVGFKPTYGLVSRYGLVAYAASLDQIGIATRTVYDNALILSAIAGHDTRDSSSLPTAPKDYTKNLQGTITKGLRIGIVENAIHAEGMDTEVVHAIEESTKVFTSLGAHIKKVSLPSMDYGAAIYFIISRAEAASNLARYDGALYGLRSADATSLASLYANTRQEGFGTEVKARILIGNYVLSAGHADEFYNNAKKAQMIMRQEFIKIFEEVDLLLAPTHPAPAFAFGAFAHNKLQMDLQDYFTCAANIVGIPALSLPCGFSKDKLPIGMQLIGPHLSEEVLFQVADAYEQQTSWHLQHPQEYM